MKMSKGPEESKILFHSRRQQEAPEELGLMKREAFEAFMRHPAATEDEFERLWPATRDELFVRFVADQLIFHR